MYLYIIYSVSRDRHYIGETSNVETRVQQHNTGYFKSSSTAGATDWTPVLIIHCGDRSKARQVEAFLKRQRNREFLVRFIYDEPYRSTLLGERFGIHT
jgi:putative endonuclease